MHYTLLTKQFWLQKHTMYPQPLQGQALVTSTGLHAASVTFLHVRSKTNFVFFNQNQICSNFHMILLKLLLFFCQFTTVSVYHTVSLPHCPSLQYQTSHVIYTQYSRHDNEMESKTKELKPHLHLSNTGVQTSLYERFISCLVFIRFHFV